MLAKLSSWVGRILGRTPSSIPEAHHSLGGTDGLERPIVPKELLPNVDKHLAELKASPEELPLKRKYTKRKKLSRSKTRGKYRCTDCKKTGHNRRTCPETNWVRVAKKK